MLLLCPWLSGSSRKSYSSWKTLSLLLLRCKCRLGKARLLLDLEVFTGLVAPNNNGFRLKELAAVALRLFGSSRVMWMTAPPG